MDASESYNWKNDRDSVSINVSQANDILADLGLECTSLHHCANPRGMFSVNKVFIVSVENKKEIAGATPSKVVIKISHPWWNGTGKVENEARALRFVERHMPSVPVPHVLSYHSHDPLSEDLWYNDTKREEHRLAMQLDEENKSVKEKYEYIVMSFVDGTNLGQIWEDLSWEERKPWIEETVKTLVDMKQNSFSMCGNWVDDEYSAIGKINVECKLKEFSGPFASFVEQHTSIITGILSKAKTRCGGRLLEEETNLGLERVVANLKSDPVFDLPLVLALHDIAPKNILVNPGEGKWIEHSLSATHFILQSDTGKIVAMVDFEWAKPDFFGDDVAEMVYALSKDERVNESFTDYNYDLVPFQEQADFVYETWSHHIYTLPKGNIALKKEDREESPKAVPITKDDLASIVRKRAKVEETTSTLQYIFRSDTKATDKDFQELREHLDILGDILD